MKSVTKSSSVAWALALCLVLSALFADAAGAADASKVLRVPIDEEPDSFNVARVSDYYSAMVAFQVIEELIFFFLYVHSSISFSIFLYL